MLQSGISARLPRIPSREAVACMLLAAAEEGAGRINPSIESSRVVVKRPVRFLRPFCVSAYRCSNGRCQKELARKFKEKEGKLVCHFGWVFCSS